MNNELTILEMYTRKDTFTLNENELINKSIDRLEVCLYDIHETIMGYIYERMKNEYPNVMDEDIWEFTDENISNGMTAKENYNMLVQFITNKIK